MPEEQQKPDSKTNQGKGFWQSLSIFQKAVFGIIVIGFILIAYNFLFAGIKSLYELIFLIFLGIVLTLILYVVLVAGEIFFRKKYYSPKEDYFTRLINLAVDYKPTNLNNLYFQGSKEKRSVYAGKIIGCLGIPYLVGIPKLDQNGKTIMIESKYFSGQKIPLFEQITYGEDGDTLFVVEKSGGLFGLFKGRQYIRCNREFHGDLHGDVVIYDINPVPYGKFFIYPFKQLQGSLPQIKMQSLLETVLQTFEHQSDLISQSADAGIYYNPYFKFVEKTNAERSMEG